MVSEAERTALSAELEAALVRELARTYHQVNASYFKGALRPPTLLLSASTARLGRFDAAHRTLEIARHLALGQPWGTVVEVLKHEMAHQYVLEVLRVEGESAHGPAFRDVCARLGVDARAAGLPSPVAAADDEAERVLARVAKLLALAESQNLHEAESAMRAAQRLMLKHNVAQAGAPRGDRTYAFRHLGRPTGRVSEHERIVAAILAAHFFVETIWVPVYRPAEGRHGSVLEVCGAPHNLEMAAYVHSFLHHAAETLWREHQRAIGTRSNRDRRTYLAGVMTGFSQKLVAERANQQKEGLVWVGDAELRGYLRRRHPYVTTVRYAGNARNEAHAQGREAGKRLVLSKPVRGGPAGGGPKLLGS